MGRITVRSWRLRPVHAFIALLVFSAAEQSHAAESVRTSSAVYTGTSPFAEPIRQLLNLSTNSAPELIEWKLTLHRDEATLAPVRYELHCSYGTTMAGKPGIGKIVDTLKREGPCVTTRGTKSNTNATVHELQRAFSVVQISSNLLHILNPDRSLMIGNGGWSYTLNSAAASEKSIEPALAATVPDMSYQIAPLASGAAVFAVFEGRTPAQGIATQLGIPVHAAATKAKWRITLYQNPDTQKPSNFKIEGTLFRPAAREGTWKILHGTPLDEKATAYELTFSESAPRIAPVRLLKGDDNVLFFLDASCTPLVGHSEFSYTVNRRTTAPELSQFKTRPRP